MTVLGVTGLKKILLKKGEMMQLITKILRENVKLSLERLSAGVAVTLLFVACSGDLVESKSSSEPGYASWKNAELDAALAEGPSAKDREYFESLNRDCSKPYVHKLENMPVDHNHPEKGRFTYYYAHFIHDINAPTVVYLPGGPGGRGMSAEQNENFNIIATDTRGLGCNFGTEKTFNLDVLTSEQSAQDLVKVIEDLKLKSYVIYGTSYGSIPGTILASKLEKSKIVPPPNALVLDGVLGKAPVSYQDFWAGAFRQWDRLRNEEPRINALFKDGPLPLNGSANAWGNYLVMTGQRYDETRTTLLALVDELNLFESTGIKGSTMKSLEKILAEPIPGYEPESSDLTLVANSIGCQELWKTQHRSVAFYLQPGGKLELRLQQGAPTADDCIGIPFRYPYDSARYSVHAPIYYFNGETDPATSPESGRYHYYHQRDAKIKHFITVKHGGHVVLLTSPDLAPCSKKIWDEIFELGNLSALLNEDGHCR
ncbi:MAG: alpha/beta fold hydrolase [Oligoflexales bacterium]|nr:alpha/beta fold hydrolase [Oligoflexales bacterium]